MAEDSAVAGPAAHSVSAGHGLDPRFGDIQGVLFDIDETLVDLEYAMSTAFRAVSEHLLPGLDAAGWQGVGKVFTHGTTHLYDRYLAGELSFNEQRILRGRAAFGHVGVDFPDDEAAQRWVESYAETQHGHLRAFEDVVPLLDALDAAGVPYGAVSNNVHDYQRAKLDRVGLQRITHLVGTDTVGVPKPDPAIYLEGVRLLGTSAARTLYVGDNLLLDAQGATAAGLVGVWLNRGSALDEDFAGAQIASLGELLGGL